MHKRSLTALLLAFALLIASAASDRSGAVFAQDMTNDLTSIAENIATNTPGGKQVSGAIKAILALLKAKKDANYISKSCRNAEAFVMK